MLLSEEMELKVEGINSGKDYNTRVFNLIKKLETDGELENFIRIVVNQKPNSPYLKEIKSEFKKIIEEDEVEYPPQVSSQGSYLEHRRKLARPVFDVGTSGEIRIIGNCGYLADPIAWQPFGLASAIYWLSTGKVDVRLQ